ncbi:MAG: endolytic transglycosylase MltG [Lautropia sp.]
MARFLANVLRLALVALVVATTIAGYQWWRYGHEPVIAAGQKTGFEIRRGAGGNALAPLLRGAGIDVAAWELAAAWRLRGDAAQVKAGRYEFEGPVTLAGLLDQLVVGQPDKERMIALIDGWTFRQVREALARAPELQNTAAGISDAELMQRIDPAQQSPEGWFAPDTYAYRPGSTDVELLTRAYRLQQQRLDAAWQRRSPALAVSTPQELLILASIVEKESGREEDRPMIAAVFNNRLRLKMLLQSDPTTIYGMAERFDGNLRRNDLKADTPYNTYQRSGLTPTPIAMPGRNALEATAQPAASNMLYFVARGDGTTEFSPDLAAHNRAVNKYQRKLK